jgi:hypothetical protein
MDILLRMQLLLICKPCFKSFVRVSPMASTSNDKTSMLLQVTSAAHEHITGMPVSDLVAALAVQDAGATIVEEARSKTWYILIWDNGTAKRILAAQPIATPGMNKRVKLEYTSTQSAF